MDDRDIDRLLAGNAPQGDPDLAQLAEVLQAMGDAYPEPSTEALASSHVAAMMETAHLLAENGEPAGRPASNADGPASRASGLPKLRRLTLKDIWAKKGAKVATIAIAAVLSLGGTAFAGVLPQPVQNIVSSAAGTVGISLPTGSMTATYTVPPGYLAHHSDEVSATFVGPIGAGPGNSSHEASHTLVPGNNGLHLGWAIGRHLGWTKGLRGQDESGTVAPDQGGTRDKGPKPPAKGAGPKDKRTGSNATAGPGSSGDGGQGGPGKGKGKGKSGH
jgi:hypothetical protein